MIIDKVKKNKLVTVLSCVSILSMLTGGAIYALPQASTVNTFETGVVDIDLTEYQLVDNKETEVTTTELDTEEPTDEITDEENEEDVELEEAEDGIVVLPGQVVSKIPRVHNSGNDCFVRAKITFEGTEEELEDDIFGMESNWFKAEDGYYYYTDILKNNQDVDIFQGIEIPTDFSQEEQDGTFTCDIDVDAIQSANFMPDFASATPWGTIHVVAYEKGEDYDLALMARGSGRAFAIEYQGDANSLIVNADDFFEDFPAMLPGDEYEDAANIVNNDRNDVKLYFRSEVITDSKLLDEVQIKITSLIDGENQTVYEGPIRATELSEDKLLGTVPSDANGKLDFAISVPKELGNEYATLTNQVKWTFSTEPIIKTGIAPRTGDNTKASEIGLYLMLLGIASASMIVILTTRKQ